MRPSRGQIRLQHVSFVLLFLAGLALSLILLYNSLRQKEPTPAQLRGVTREMALAVQKLTVRNTEVGMRPERLARPGKDGRAPDRAFVTDHIYITLTDAPGVNAISSELDRLAASHGLQRFPSAPDGSARSRGVARMDYGLGARRTHAIHIVTRLVSRPAEKIPQPQVAGSTAQPLLAIIIDDLGNDRVAADNLFSLAVPVTVSVLPNLPFSTDVAEEAHRRGYHVMLHLPMAANGDAKHEAGELRSGTDAQAVGRTIGSMLDSVPHAIGVNNHQGSRATQDEALMAAVMAALAERKLFFVDSRTSSASVAYSVARRAGLPAAYRSVFLDDTATREETRRQLQRAEQQAREQGWSIAIGHPHPSTLEALEQFLPQLEKRGVRLVFASQLVR